MAISIVGLLIAWLPIWLGVILMRAAKTPIWRIIREVNLP